MAKPKPIRIPSDACEVPINGQTYHPHEGEWAEIMPGFLVRDQRMAVKVMRLQQAAKASKGDDDEQQQQVIIMGDVNAELCAALAAKVLAWNWTDMRGQPIPLDGTPEPFYALSALELLYLLSLTGAETAVEKKVGSKRSGTTSSATGPRPSPNGSSTARKPTRA